MTPPLLAACVVVTDEVHDLHACLTSLERLKPLVAEINVYGINADERVLEYARNSGASVAAWQGVVDEAEARNRAIAMTNAHWVLVMDSGEKVVADKDRLSRLLVVEPGMMAQPDAMSVQVRGDDEERTGREPRLLRQAVARYGGGHNPTLEPKTSGRRLTVLTPGRDVIAVSVSSGDGDPVIERARIDRRIQRADAAIADLEERGVGGDELVTALVERARLLRSIEEDNAALADLTRARSTRATKQYRHRARQELASLLIRHGHFAAAEQVIDELERDDADADYTQWLRALSAGAQGQARTALESMRELDDVVSADGRKVPTPAILNERMVLAARVGEFDEALDCCVQLVAVHGQSKRYARMLMKLWGGRSPEALADMLVKAGGRNQTAVAESLRQMPDPGPAVAESLLDESREEKPLAVRVM